METTTNGVIKATSLDIYNVDPFNINATILDEHVDKVASESTLGHVKLGTGLEVKEDGKASVKIADDLTTKDASTVLSANMGVELNKSIVNTNIKLAEHVDNVATETRLGHIKIGTGIQMTDDLANVKIANDLVTVDATTALSAKMGKELNENKAPKNHASSGTTYGTGNSSQYGHVKLSDNYTSSAGAAWEGVGASSKAITDAYDKLNSNLANTTQTITAAIQEVENQLPPRPLSQKGFVDDCLQDTLNAGYYQYYYTAKNKPSDIDGIVISVPWFEKTDEWHNKFNFRLAIDINGNLFTSVYKEGESWGSWNLK